jgi:putative aldouronate transport system substrate-binding protein
MKNKWSVRLSALLLALFLSLTLTNCGSEDRADEFLPDGTAAYKDLKPVSLSFCFPGAQPKGWPDVKAEIEKQTVSTLNAKLDFKWLEYQTYTQTIQTQSASENLYDAFICGQPQQYYPDFTKLAREGQIKDITDLFPNSAPELYQKYSKEELAYANVDGKLYAVPSLDPHAYCTYILANAELLKKFGIVSLETYEDYEKYLQMVKNDNTDLIPGTISNGVDTLKLFSRGSGYVIVDQVQMLVYKWDDPQMKVIPWERTPEFKTAVSYLVSWYKNGLLGANPDAGKTSSFVYYGMLSPPSAEATRVTYNTSSGEIKQSDPMNIFYLFPDRTVQRDNPMGSFYFNGSFVFSAKSENTDRALMFLDWVQKSRSNYTLMMYGIENKDYVLKDGYPTLPEGGEFQDRSYMYWDGYWSFNNIEYMLGESASREDGAVNPKEFLDKNTKYPPHGAFYPNYTQLQQAADERARAFMDFEWRLNGGSVKDFTEIDAFIKELGEKGTDNIVEFVQKQLDGNKNR